MIVAHEEHACSIFIAAGGVKYAASELYRSVPPIPEPLSSKDKNLAQKILSHLRESDEDNPVMYDFALKRRELDLWQGLVESGKIRDTSKVVEGISVFSWEAVKTT